MTYAQAQSARLGQRVAPETTYVQIFDVDPDTPTADLVEAAWPGMLIFRKDRSILQIFMVQGMVMGVVGTGAGVITGIITALNVDVIVKKIEELLRIKFLSPDVYLIPDLPSDLQANDVVWVALVAFLLSLLATIYPSWRAARVNPAEALRYE